MAVALSWKGYVDTDLEFSEFFDQSHTITLRFMPHYPDTYEGPMVAENSRVGTFILGVGDYSSGTDGAKLYLAVGNQSRAFAAALTAGSWHHLALRCTVGASRTYKLYLDGVKLGQDLVVASGASGMPQGRVRFGKRTSGRKVNSRDAQFYGLLDDVAVFTRALSVAEINDLRTQVPHLKGTEADLLAGYTFAGGGLPAKLARPVSYHHAAGVVSTSSDRSNSKDKKLLPLPTEQVVMDLPFPPGEAWKAIQAPDGLGGSHQGYAAFCWDFVVADQPQGGEYPKGSDGAPFYAAAPGTVLTVRESAPPGTSQYSNYVEIEQATREICAYLHLQQNSCEVSKNDNVKYGQKLALTGDTGTPVGAFHPHVAVSDDKDQASGFVTFPVAFNDYEVRSGSTWKSVPRGMPRSNEVVRNPPTPKFGTRSLLHTNAIARGGSLLDVVATDTAGRAWVARWKPNTYAGNWDRWRPALHDVAANNTPVSVVSRHADKLDIFVAGQDGKTYTGAWDAKRSNQQWRGWWNVLSGKVPPGGIVTGVARASQKLDIFLVSTDGFVYTAAWDNNVAQGKWRGWWRIGNLKAKPGSHVAAVARDPNKLDIFVAGVDGKTYTAAWDQHVSQGQWRGWWNILEGHVPAGGTISAVSRAPDKLDIFLVSNDNRVYTAAWQHGVAQGKWRGWWRIGSRQAMPGSPVGVVARDPNKLDVFVAGIDGRTYTAAWDQHVARGRWRGWWNILRGSIKPGSAVAAVSRHPQKLDVFIVSTDGNVWTAAWDQNVANGDWRGWWRIG